MVDFQKQIAFEAKLAQLYDGLASKLKVAVSQQDFILEFLIIEINGKAMLPDKPDTDAFEFSDEDYAQVVAIFKSVYA